MDSSFKDEKSYIEIKKKVINRLNRIEGQVRGIKKMLEEEQDCNKILEQLSSLRASVDSTGITIVTCALYSKIKEDIEEGKSFEYTVSESMKPFIKGVLIDSQY